MSLMEGGTCVPSSALSVMPHLHTHTHTENLYNRLSANQETRATPSLVCSQYEVTSMPRKTCWWCHKGLLRLQRPWWLMGVIQTHKHWFGHFICNFLIEVWKMQPSPSDPTLTSLFFFFTSCTTRWITTLRLGGKRSLLPSSSVARILFHILKVPKILSTRKWNVFGFWTFG